MMAANANNNAAAAGMAAAPGIPAEGMAAVPGIPDGPPQAADPLDEVRDVLERVGCNHNVRDRWVETHGMTSLRDFRYITPDDVTEFATQMNTGVRTAANKMGGITQKKLQGFLYWFHDRLKRQQPIAAAMFTVDVMDESIEEFTSVKANEKADDIDIDVGKVETEMKWWDWKEQFESMLWAIKGAGGDSLYYIIRPPLAAGEQPTEERLVRVYQIPLQGVNFRRDNERVWAELQKCCLGTVTYALIREHDDTKNGRAAWQKLVAHCEGESANNKRLVLANRAVSLDPQNGGLFWREEYGGFTFSQYVVKLQQAYEIIKKYSYDTPPQARVTRLSDGMKNSATEIANAKSYVRHHYADNFEGAVAYFSTEIAFVYPPKSGNARNRGDRYGRRRVSQASRDGNRGRGGRGRGRGGRQGRGNGGRGGGGGRHDPSKGWFHGIDCSQAKNLSKADWDAIGQDGRDYVRERREEYKARQDGGSKRKAAEISTNKGADEDQDADDVGDGDEGAGAPAYDAKKGAKSGSRFGRNNSYGKPT